MFELVEADLPVPGFVVAPAPPQSPAAARSASVDADGAGSASESPCACACPRVPSADALGKLFSGGQGALKEVAVTTVGRAALIGIGLWFAGTKKGIVRKSLAGALAVEAFLLAWLVYRRKRAP